MKKILLLVVMLSIALFSVGSVYAIQGTPDDVPGQDVVIPIVCEDSHLIDTPVPVSPVIFTLANTGVDDGTMNTLWAIAEVTGNPVTARLFVFNTQSQFVKDTTAEWTANDVVGWDCKGLIANMSQVQRAKMVMEVTKNGVPEIIYAGYLIYENTGFPQQLPFVTLDPTDQFISWVYQVDLPNGFAAGFNGYDVEGGVDQPNGFQSVPSNLWENGNPGGTLNGRDDSVPVSVSAIMPRYFFLNTDPGTFNWWYILKGGPVNAFHNLDGFICNEEEDCISLNIPVPLNFNIIDVSTFIPSSVFHSGTNEASAAENTPAAEAAEVDNTGGGFGVFNPKTGITPGFFNCTDPDFIGTCTAPTPADLVSTLGWAYQRAATGGIITNWDVIHPMHAIRPENQQTGP